MADREGTTAAQRATDEVIRFHSFYAAWYRGETPETDETFDTGVTAVTFPVDGDVFETEWHITGIDDFVTGDEPSRQPRELSDFARVCIESQLGRTSTPGDGSQKDSAH